MMFRFINSHAVYLICLFQQEIHEQGKNCTLEEVACGLYMHLCLDKHLGFKLNSFFLIYAEIFLYSCWSSFPLGVQCAVYCLSEDVLTTHDDIGRGQTFELFIPLYIISPQSFHLSVKNQGKKQRHRCSIESNRTIPWIKTEEPVLPPNTFSSR